MKSQKEITMEIAKYFDMKENKNTTYQNLGCSKKAVLRRNFTAINDNTKKSQPNLLPLTREIVAN